MSETVYRWDGPPSIELRRERVTLPTGHSYLAHTLVTADGRRGVVIVARRGADILLVRSYRPALGRHLWELPRGFGEADIDDPAGAVHDGERELREETGYVVRSATDSGGYITDSSVLPTEVRVIECVVEPTAVPGRSDDEASEVRWFPSADLPRLIADGTLADAHTLAALSIAGALTGSS